MYAIIDGDILVYRCGFAAEKNRYLVQLHNKSSHVEYREFDGKREASEYVDRVTDDGSSAIIWNYKDLQPVEKAVEIIDTTINSIYSSIEGMADSEILITGSGNFREAVAKTRPYKGNREDSLKPVHYGALRKHLLESHAAELIDGEEADDRIGSLATELKNAGIPYIIVTTDKDLDQIPGDHFNWVSKERYTVSPKEAKMFFFQQWLSGDPVDNVPGIPKMGPSKAKALLANYNNPKDMLHAVVEEYKKAYPSTYRDICMEQARLVYIRRAHGVDFLQTKEGEECLKLLS